MSLSVGILHGEDYPNVKFSSERSWAGGGWRLPGRSGFRCGEKDIVLPRPTRGIGLKTDDFKYRISHFAGYIFS